MIPDKHTCICCKGRIFNKYINKRARQRTTFYCKNCADYVRKVKCEAALRYRKYEYQVKMEIKKILVKPFKKNKQLRITYPTIVKLIDRINKIKVTQ